jgi:hypothetical protein
MQGKQSNRVRRELLPDLLHELAQPISALQCATEITLRKPRTVQEYVLALEQIQQTASGMRRTMEFFRERWDASDPCDGSHPLAIAPVISAVAE